MPNTPGTLDITLHQNTTFQYSFALTDSEAAAIDLTGATAFAEVGKVGVAAALDLSPTVDSPASGGIISIAAAVGSTPTGNYTWDLLVQYADTTVQKILTGKATVAATISEVS